MREIADLVGVSVSTVSRALNGDPVVNAETRARVAEVAARLDYRFNPTARSLRLQRTSLVLAVVPDIGNPFYSYVLAGIEDEAQRQGYAVLVGNMAGDERRLASYGEQLLSGRVDGLILLTGRLPSPDFLDRLPQPPPVVALCERIDRLPFIGIDERAAGREVTAHLISNGRRTIAHVRGPDWSRVAEARLDGWRDALAAAGETAAPDLVEAGDTTIDGGDRAARAILARRSGVDAVFAGNDEMAIGVVNALRDLGIRVPEDVQVAGCDGLELSAKYYPPITTVEQPRVALGTAAMAALERRIQRKDVAQELILPHRLVRRLTTSPR